MSEELKPRLSYLQIEELGSLLSAAWKKYIFLLQEVPHGTVPQMKALVAVNGTEIAEAIAAWNQRPSDAVIEQQAAKLRELKPGWDNDNAPAISELAIQSALAVLRTRGQMVPCSNGGIQIDWPNWMELTLLPNGEQNFDALPNGISAELTAARESLRVAREAIEGAQHSGDCDSRRFEVCSICRTPRDKHGFATAGCPKGGSEVPTLGKWNPAPKLPCNCFKKVLAALDATKEKP